MRRNGAPRQVPGWRTPGTATRLPAITGGRLQREALRLRRRYEPPVRHIHKPACLCGRTISYDPESGRRSEGAVSQRGQGRLRPVLRLHDGGVPDGREAFRGSVYKSFYPGRSQLSVASVRLKENPPLRASFTVIFVLLVTMPFFIS